MALAGTTDQIIYLEEGDVVDLQLRRCWIVDRSRQSRRSAKCAPCMRIPARPNSAPTAITCKRKYSSSRARLPIRSKASTGIMPELFGDAAYRIFQQIDCGADTGLRHQLLCRLDRQVLDRIGRQSARSTSRSPANTATATACRTRTRWW